jgi:hypothetical protein
MMKEISSRTKSAMDTRQKSFALFMQAGERCLPAGRGINKNDDGSHINCKPVCDAACRKLTEQREAFSLWIRNGYRLFLIQ